MTSFAEATIVDERVELGTQEAIAQVEAILFDQTDDEWHRLVSFADVEDGPECGTITELEDAYPLLTGIPYEISRLETGDWLASVPDANIAITGFDRQDAYQSLVAEILDTLDALRRDAAVLSPAAAHQLHTLQRYLGA